MVDLIGETEKQYHKHRIRKRQLHRIKCDWLAEYEEYAEFDMVERNNRRSRPNTEQEDLEEYRSRKAKRK
jgi:hypothetical protein